MSTLIVALVLLPLALALLAGLVVLLVRPLLQPALAALERARFQRVLARAARAETYVRAKQIDVALLELEAAFCYMIVRSDTRLAEQIARHHVGLLSRLLSIADDAPQQRIRLFALAKVERLIDRRNDMQRAYLQLRARPRGDGRRSQLVRDLEINARETRAAVRELISDLHLLTTRKVAYQ